MPHTAEFAVHARVAYAQILLADGRASEAEALARTAILAAESLGAPLLLAIAHRTAEQVAAASLSPSRRHPRSR